MGRVKKTDVFIAIFLILLFAVISIGIFSPQRSEGEDRAVITMRVDGVSLAVADQLLRETSFLVDERYRLEPVRIDGDRARLLYTDGSGTIKELPSETKYTLTLMLRASGAESESGFLLGSVRYIAPNMSLTVSGEACRVWGRIIDIDPDFSTSNK